MSEILLGAGSNWGKKLFIPGKEKWVDRVTLDYNGDHGVDIVHDLLKLPYPFEDNCADEIHAYEVMEHLGQQGDWRWFFDQWSELWRVLKPGGLFFGTSPAPHSPWAWGDPSHTRIVGPECLVFLNQPAYTAQVGKTPMSDFRFCFKADFDVVHTQITPEASHHYVLKAVKPSRISI